MSEGQTLPQLSCTAVRSQVDWRGGQADGWESGAIVVGLKTLVQTQLEGEQDESKTKAQKLPTHPVAACVGPQSCLLDQHNTIQHPATKERARSLAQAAAAAACQFAVSVNSATQPRSATQQAKHLHKCTKCVKEAESQHLISRPFSPSPCPARQQAKMTACTCTVSMSMETWPGQDQCSRACMLCQHAISVQHAHAAASASTPPAEVSAPARASPTRKSTASLHQLGPPQHSVLDNSVLEQHKQPMAPECIPSSSNSC